MNGAESLVCSLLNSDVDMCFTNPGTSEMHFVAALDKKKELRCVLGLFEGVVTGMADGYGRMADKPAATLLHLGPGLANGLANLHNAKKANTPIVNIIGEHATHHIKLNAPLTSDIEGIATPVSDWVKTSRLPSELEEDAAEAISIAKTAPGKISSLILPADVAWGEAKYRGIVKSIPILRPIPQSQTTKIANVLSSGKRNLIHLTGRALRCETLELLGKIQAKTGCRLSCMTSNSRWQRGAGRVSIERIQYPIDIALKQLSDVENIVLLGTPLPVSFFAYPDKPSVLIPKSCKVFQWAEKGDDIVSAISDLVDELDANSKKALMQESKKPILRTGELSLEAISCAIGNLIPENAIFVDESVSSGRGFMPFTEGSNPHDWLALTGGSIGLGLPMATGASIACPDQKVICAEGDGSAMYTIQSLWTQARESCDVVNIIFNNRGYSILKDEFKNVGANNMGANASRMMKLTDPAINWLSLSNSLGVPATCSKTADEFNLQLERALNSPGPHLIEAVIS